MHGNAKVTIESDQMVLSLSFIRAKNTVEWNVLFFTYNVNLHDSEMHKGRGRGKVKGRGIER